MKRTQHVLQPLDGAHLLDTEAVPSDEAGPFTALTQEESLQLCGD